MRWAILLGLLLVATPLVLRAGSADPFPNDQSYLTLSHLEETTVGAAFAIIPPQLFLLIAAALFLFIIGTTTAPESFFIFLVTAPAFLTTFTTISTGSIGAILIALGSVLLLRKHVWAVALVPLCFLAGTHIGILGSMTFIVIAIANGLPFVALGVSFFALISSIAFAFTGTISDLGFVNPSALWTDLLIGGTGGITLFLLAIGILGFLLKYKETKEGITFLPLVLVILAPLFRDGGIIVAATLAYAGSIAWEYLVSREWKFEELGSITLVLIACSILFTTIVTVKETTTINDDRIALRTFVREALPRNAHIADDAQITGALRQEGFRTGRAEMPRDASFVASALTEQGYHYIITREAEPLYSHFPILFTTDSPTSYRIYEVPRR